MRPEGPASITGVPRLRADGVCLCVVRQPVVRFLGSKTIAATLLLATSCGGGGNENTTGVERPPVNTLAYVVTECREGAAEGSSRQTLFIRQGEADPIEIMKLPWSGPLPVGRCASLGLSRFSLWAVFAGAFQRIGVSHDGSMVAFEVTDDFALDAVDRLVPDDKEGFSAVHAEGPGLVRLGPASREAGFRLVPFPAVPT